MLGAGAGTGARAGAGAAGGAVGAGAGAGGGACTGAGAGTGTGTGTGAGAGAGPAGTAGAGSGSKATTGAGLRVGAATSASTASPSFAFAFAAFVEVDVVAATAVRPTRGGLRLLCPQPTGLVPSMPSIGGGGTLSAARSLASPHPMDFASASPGYTRRSESWPHIAYQQKLPQLQPVCGDGMGELSGLGTEGSWGGRGDWS